MTTTEISSKTTNLTTELVSAVDKWSSSFWRLTIPNELFSNSSITSVTEESGNAIYAVLLYGERRGELKEVPYDHSELKQKITDLAQESLWLYIIDSKGNEEQPPQGIETEKRSNFYIPTGKIHRCHRCSGQGQVKCSTCGGRGSVKRERDGRTYWEPCSCCRGGLVECGHCAGYGWIQQVIKCFTEYKTSKTQDFEYSGPVPKSDFAKARGQTLFEEEIDYPQDLLRTMLTGGIDPNEYLQLQNIVKGKLHEAITHRLTAYEGNLRLVHELVDRFLGTMPNPVQANKLLEYEIIPVRLRVKVERKPVYKVTYAYKSETYELWVYGTERKVYAPKKPREFTNKAIIFSVVLVIAIIAAIVIALNPSLVGY
jgi:hypothetical protein